MINSGKSFPDIKLQTSIGNTPFTQRFSITGVIETDTSTPKLVSPLPLLQTLPHAQLTTPSTVYVASTSNSDDIVGTGARVVFVNGLDSAYLQQEEIVLMDGQNPVQTQLTYSKIFEITVITLGTNTDANTGDLAPVGDLYVGTGTFTAGVPANPIIGIKASTNNLNSREPIFTVPDGKFLLLRSLFVSTTPDVLQNNNIEVETTFNLFGTPNDQWYKTQPHNFDETEHYVYESLVVLPPRTSIQIRAKSTGAKTK